ncbi:THO complex subunit 1 [Sparassis crispa]|uniref:THO complex subunit 1 n=1 Tax=Sparassis crispa TaxID=139825 RepID=A0A401G584_9APHY|nr:THO complex subunit 1 [Sparassis crispa]GBE77325.1 THO complex subunit 1 [Sparassis crispa]
MQAIEASLRALSKSLASGPVDQQTLDALVSKAIAGAKKRSTVSPETRKNQWEFVLRNEIFTLAATEGNALNSSNTKYYDDLRAGLDLVLTFTEHDACEHVFPFNVLYDLVEMQTIASCEVIFSWIEARTDRLTEGMVPQKGKALVLLRTLNDLLRRLSKMGATTLFCGRILTFLSQVFPLGERSGVNLRGEYGPVWDGPGAKGESERGPTMDVDAEKKEVEEDKMVVDEENSEGKEGEESAAAKEAKREQKEDFYHTFWSLQLPFSWPHAFSEPSAFPAFKDAVAKVLPVIKEATAKERALMGGKNVASASSRSLKRKRGAEEVALKADREYFFAKYLTSPELLELEVADTHFRRQFLFQLLILLNHLLNFTKGAKATWSHPRNRSLQIDFTLEPADTQWVHDTAAKATEELRQTAPGGRAFAETVKVVLEREKNWVRWKNELCSPFDRDPWSEEVTLVDGTKKRVGLEEATVEVRKRMRVEPKDWEHKLGSGPLTEIWAMGYRDMNDLRHPFQPGDVKDFVKKVKQEDIRIEMRRTQLIRTAERIQQARAKVTATHKEAAAHAGAASPAAGSPMHLSPSSSQEAISAGQPAHPRAIHASPLHPSLPAKPGTTPVPSSTSQDSLVALSSSPARVSTPVPPAPVAPTAAPAHGETAPVVLPPDDQITQYEENKQRWSWLALRTARDQYMQHLGKIGTGDITLLLQDIEQEAEEKRERAAAEESTPGSGVVGGSGDERAASPITAGANANASGSTGRKANGDRDVKMDPEER